MSAIFLKLLQDMLVARNIDPPIRKILQRIIITIPKIKLFQNIINFYK